MKIFISHARKDSDLALKLADRLKRSGFAVLRPETEMAPDELGSAPQYSEFMIFLLTPGALEADTLRKDIEYALGSKKYDGRVFSVFVGPTIAAGKDMPWILLKLPWRQVESAKDFGEVAHAIENECAKSEKSSSNA